MVPLIIVVGSLNAGLLIEGIRHITVNISHWNPDICIKV